MSAGARWAAALLALPLAANATTITIQVNDAPGVGFNDTTPVEALPTNSATTRGGQRLNLFQFAAARWAERLQSNVEIVVRSDWAGFNSSQCNASGGVLGHAGTFSIFRNFTGAPQTSTFYPSALADALHGSNLEANAPDIVAEFNPNIDGDPACLNGIGFYYGTDHQTNGKVDLLNVLLHEIGHGLGFSSFVSLSSGAPPAPGNFGIFEHFLFDEDSGLFWTEMDSTERLASATNNGNLVWNGLNVDRGADVLTAGRNAVHGHVRMYAPTTLAGGSSVSHWDTPATPNLVMEPFITNTRASQKLDLTTCLLRDIGWTLKPPFGCPDFLSDVGVAVAESADPAHAGAPLTYTLTVSNNGPDRATGVSVDAGLSGISATLDSVTPSTGGCSALPCALGVLDSGASATVTLGVTPTGVGTLNLDAQALADEHDTAAANDAASASTTIAAGGDTTPDAFHFTDRTGTGTHRVVTSNTITVAGIDGLASISFQGNAAAKAYSINGGAFVTTPGVVVNGNTVQLHLTSAPTPNTMMTMRLIIGGVADAWTVTTGATDNTPDAFAFTDVTSAALGSVITSDTVTVSGINAPASLSLKGPASRRYSINGGAFTNLAGATVNNGDTVQLQVRSSAKAGRNVNTTLTLGGIRNVWSVATAP